MFLSKKIMHYTYPFYYFKGVIKNPLSVVLWLIYEIWGLTRFKKAENLKRAVRLRGIAA
jgi:hypothetical protein